MKAERYSIRVIREDYVKYVLNNNEEVINNPQPYEDWAKDNVIDFTVLAHGHEQHIWSETSLIGVSKQGCKRLDELKAANYKLYVTVGGRGIKLIGWEEFQ